MHSSDTLDIDGYTYKYFPVSEVEGYEVLPMSLSILLENVLRNVKDETARQTYCSRIVDAARAGVQGSEIEYMPARVLLQDFTGVPVFVDLAVMREAAQSLGGNPERINPQIPLDLVIDHSVIADYACCPDALERNMEMEFERNSERYRFLKWAQKSFKNVRIVPPGVGICHQINVERFAQGVMTAKGQDGEVAYFDTVVGTDSHTTTANGLSVLSWGVGGIEAEAAALGQPITTLVPRVVGMKLTGRLENGASAMDVALTFAEILRAKGVVGAFVECFGPGVETLSATQRACIANMTPEYGCTCTLFPVDGNTIEYLRLTGRSEDQLALVEGYAKAQGLWADEVRDARRVYNEVIELDLGSVRKSLAGPSRPHNRFDFEDAPAHFASTCAQRGVSEASAEVDFGDVSYTLENGAIAIAAVTSCTTATDPAMMIACGLLARNAVARGLKPKPWVKRVMAPGSHATSLILERAGLVDSLDELGFNMCGYGCMSCIGNSGPVWPQMHEIADKVELCSVLSGNRNFDGRISPDVAQNFLCAPAGVVAYALAGTLDFDFDEQPLGFDEDGEPVYLCEIWPSDDEIDQACRQFVTVDVYEESGKDFMEGTSQWAALDVRPSALFQWEQDSGYVRRAPYFDDMKKTQDRLATEEIAGARALALLGDFITTDHISPAGTIPLDSPAADYLRNMGYEERMFNTYGSRRGNHEVMARGGFGNVKLSNALADGRMGGYTKNLLDGEVKSIFDASEDYRAEGIPLVVVAGKMYGSGSSRDWAAKAPLLLGVKAVFAESFERIHRSNLIGMGIIPLQFLEGQNAESLGLDGSETYDIPGIDLSKGLPPQNECVIKAEREDGASVEFSVRIRIDTPTEGFYLANGGILQYVLRNLV